MFQKKRTQKTLATQVKKKASKMCQKQRRFVFQSFYFVKALFLQGKNLENKCKRSLFVCF
jgi:hypothetical protein